MGDHRLHLVHLDDRILVCALEQQLKPLLFRDLFRTHLHCREVGCLELLLGEADHDVVDVALRPVCRPICRLRLTDKSARTLPGRGCLPTERPSHPVAACAGSSLISSLIFSGRVPVDHLVAGCGDRDRLRANCTVASVTATRISAPRKASCRNVETFNSESRLAMT